MRKYLSVIAAAGALALGAIAATPAAAIQFIGKFTVTDYHNGSNNGLNIDLSRTTGNLNFDLLAVGPGGGNFYETKLFDIWAGESIGSDDYNWDPIKVNFNFSSPVTGGDVNGVTGGVEGQWIIWPIWQAAPDGEVNWSNVGSFNFGNNGILKVQLSNADFRGSSDKGQVNAKFWLEKMPSSAVPEPATWAMMITGFGLAGTAIRRRRSLLAHA
jgi:hypothetical protein